MSVAQQQVTRAATVSEYAARIGRALRQVGAGVVEGEVQQPRRVGNGMLVFDLTDGDALLSCKVFARDVRGLEHVPRHGDLVKVAIERPDFWPATGRVSVIVTRVRLAGEGELLRRRAELLERLRVEGLCDAGRRTQLPEFPRAVGVIAGRASDGMSDVVRALVDRFPPVHVVTCAALVQGAAAPRDLIDALARMEEHPLVDVVVVARGGGSVQDLVAFDDERLCRALFACSKPVITAIGHTDNVPVCNHVAWAAYTPSRSAEMAVPSAAELRQGLALAARRVEDVPARVARGAAGVQALAAHLRARARVDALLDDVRRRGPGIHARAFFAERTALLAGAAQPLAGARAVLAARSADVDGQGRLVAMGTRRQLADHDRDYGRALARLGREAAAGIGRRLRGAASDAGHAARLVAALDMRPRGWLLAACDDGAPVRRAEEVRPGAELRLHFTDGRVTATARDIETERT